MLDPISVICCLNNSLIKPQCMRKGSRRAYVSLCVYLSVIALAATYLVYLSKVRWHTISCMLLKICIVWISLKTFCSGDMVLFACHDDRQLGSLLTKTHIGSRHDYK